MATTGPPVILAFYFNNPILEVAQFYAAMPMCSLYRCAFISNWPFVSPTGYPLHGPLSLPTTGTLDYDQRFFGCPENDEEAAPDWRRHGNRMHKCYAEFLNSITDGSLAAEHIDMAAPDVLFIHDDVILAQPFASTLAQLRHYDTMAFAPQFGRFPRIDLSDNATWKDTWGMTKAGTDFGQILQGVVTGLQPHERTQIGCDFPSGPCPIQRVNSDVLWVPAQAQRRMAVRMLAYDKLGLNFGLSVGLRYGRDADSAYAHRYALAGSTSCSQHSSDAAGCCSTSALSALPAHLRCVRACVRARLAACSWRDWHLGRRSLRSWCLSCSGRPSKGVRA